jgi:hypothetical protein
MNTTYFRQADGVPAVVVSEPSNSAIGKRVTYRYFEKIFNQVFTGIPPIEKYAGYSYITRFYCDKMSFERLCPLDCEKCKENVGSILQTAHNARNIYALLKWKCKQLVTIAQEKRSESRLPVKPADPYKADANPFAEYLKTI